MTHSLQHRLCLLLVTSILVTGLIATLAAFFLAYDEAAEFQDDMLRQIAWIGDQSGIRSRIDSTKNAPGADAESRLIVVHLPSDKPPAWLGANLAAGFHTTHTGTEELRVFVRVNESNTRTVVAQPTESRDEIAIDSAMYTLVPLLLFMPLIVWLTVIIIRKEFAPISRLAKRVDELPAERPELIVDEDLPREIMPFVQASNRLLQRVNQLVEQQRSFVANAAHELRTPLTALSVQAENFLQANTLAAMRQRGVPLRAGIDRACRLTEQLLGFARTQVGAQNNIDIDVSAMTRELLAELLSAAESRQIRLILEERTRIVVHASPEALGFIIRNAVENAVKFSPTNSDVIIRLSSTGNNMLVEVIDSGPGIPHAERERVFEPFFRSPNANVEGNGLGLAIVREAAERLGGMVTLHSRTEHSGLIFRYQQRCDQATSTASARL